MKDFRDTPVPVVLVGGYPPPYGGITIHIQRLYFALKQKGIPVRVLTHLSRSSPFNDPAIIPFSWKHLPRFISALVNGRKIVHFHTSQFRHLFFLALLRLLSIKQFSVVTLHSGSFIEAFQHMPFFQRILCRFLLKSFHRIIVVNQDLFNFLCRELRASHRINVIPAFLPPPAPPRVQKPALTSLFLPSWQYVLATGSLLPHYGFEILLEAFQRLVREGPNVKLILAFYFQKDEHYWHRVQSRIHTLNSNRVHWFFDLTPDEFNFLLRQVDVFVRPTLKDGDAVAVREALYWGKWVVASDCTRRPKGVLLFRSGNSQDLYRQLKKALGQSIVPPRLSSQNPLDQILSIYQQAYV